MYYLLVYCFPSALPVWYDNMCVSYVFDCLYCVCSYCLTSEKIKFVFTYSRTPSLSKKQAAKMFPRLRTPSTSACEITGPLQNLVSDIKLCRGIEKVKITWPNSTETLGQTVSGRVVRYCGDAAPALTTDSTSSCKIFWAQKSNKLSITWTNFSLIARDAMESERPSHKFRVLFGKQSLCNLWGWC